MTAEYFPTDALENFRRMDDTFLRDSVFDITLRHAKSKSLRRAVIRYALRHPGKRYLDRKSVQCSLAYFDADSGRYTRAYRSLQQLHCDRGDSRLSSAFHLKSVIASMIRRGDTQVALTWVQRAPKQYAYLFVDPVVWGLAKSGRSTEALALIEPRAGQVFPTTLLPAVAAVLPADSPFSAWLDLALRSGAGSNGQEPALQALSAAFANACGEEAVLTWMGTHLQGFKRARVLVGIAEGRRGVIPGRVRPAYWPDYGE
jgi:hypothetical protein